MNSCRISLISPFWRCIQRGLSSKPMRKLAPKFDFDVDRDVGEAIKTGSLKARNHPGIQKIKTVSLPDKLLKAVAHVLTDYPKKSLETDATKLAKYLWSRHPPLERAEYREKLEEVTQKIISKEAYDPMSPDIMEEERKRLMDSRKSKIHERMKREVYHWKPITYNDYYSAVYIVARLSPDFATLVNIMSEIKKRDASFSPGTMLDFGSGVGSGTWAMDSIWPNACKEVVCVDASAEINTVADRLLRGGNINDDVVIRPGGTFFKQFLPMSDLLKYDLVIASHSLFELPDMESRLRTLDVLWRKTAGYLVVIETGTNAGYKLVLEARDFILQLGENVEDEASNLQGHVFAPCPHNMFCPRYLDPTYIPCNFEVSYKPYSSSQKSEVGKERYSYVVLKKGKSSVKRYPRVVKEPMLRKKHIICQVCTERGTLVNITATKQKHSKECYSVLKHTKMGDSLPVVFPEQDNISSPPIYSDDESKVLSSEDIIEAKG